MNNQLDDGQALVEAGPLLTALLQRIDLEQEPAGRAALSAPSWDPRKNSAITTKIGVSTLFQPTGNAELDRIMAAAQPRVLHGVIRRAAGGDYNGAVYVSSGKLADTIILPHRAAFRSGVRYRHALAHELAHWTGAAGRCNRDTYGAHLAANLLCDLAPQAREEIAAELAAALLLLSLGEPSFATLNSAALHIHFWAAKGASDLDERRALLASAAPDAEAAASYLLRFA